MNFACIAAAAPGKTLAEQCAAIAAAGCTGVETIVFPETKLEPWVDEVRRATGAAALVPSAVILGGLALHQPGQAPWIQEALAAIGELGSAALLTPEYRAQDPLPLWPPFPTPTQEEWDCVNGQLTAMATHAVRCGVPLLLEPITQFEGRFWRTLDDALAACARMQEDSPHVQCSVVADFHNMNITEAQPATALAAAGSRIGHVHLADSNRLLPGRGHIDFRPGLQCLQRCDYRGWYTFECAVIGDFAAVLQATQTELRALAQVT